MWFLFLAYTNFTPHVQETLWRKAKEDQAAFNVQSVRQFMGREQATNLETAT